MRTATDRIDYWIRRRIVPCDALLPGNANPGSDRYVGLTTAIGQSLRDQYDALAARVPSHLAALVRQLRTRSSRAEFPGKGTMKSTMLRNRYEKNSARCMRLAKESGDSVQGQPLIGSRSARCSSENGGDHAGAKQDACLSELGQRAN
jgi:hypothetical protein